MTFTGNGVDAEFVENEYIWIKTETFDHCYQWDEITEVERGKLCDIFIHFAISLRQFANETRTCQCSSFVSSLRWLSALACPLALLENGLISQPGVSLVMLTA